MLDVTHVRKQFPLLTTPNRSGKPLIYLDNAATTQKPWVVIEALTEYYQKQNANIHRGIYELADSATQAYEYARSQVATFLNAEEAEVIFCSGTTEAINMVAHGWGRDQLGPEDEILVSGMEHHANYVPWQEVCKRTGATFKQMPLQQDGTLSLTDLGQALTSKTKLLAITHISNTTGAINSISEIADLVHKNNTLLLVDAAQSVAYQPVDVQKLGCDFLAFSGHKLYGPMGIGVLYGKKHLLDEMSPYQQGGAMILQVTAEQTTYKKAPHRFEAGTPPVAQAIGLAAALDFVHSLGLEQIKKHADRLREYAMKQLLNLPDVEIIGPQTNAGPILSLQVDSVHPHDVATILGSANIAVRAGHHCTQPLMHHFGIPGTVRMSFAVYNTPEEIDFCLNQLRTVKTIMV